MNRREFLGASGAGLLMGSTSPVPAGPNDTINVGIVGPGGRGANLIEECVEYGKKYNVRLTAVCDIWSLRRESGSALVAKASGTPPKVYRRYRGNAGRPGHRRRHNRHAGSLARQAPDPGRRGRQGRVCRKTDGKRSRGGQPGPGRRAPDETDRAERHPAAQLSQVSRGGASDARGDCRRRGKGGCGHQ